VTSDIDEAEEAMLAIAGGDIDEAWTAAWLRERVRFVNPG
jgi:prophage maintenance system killer protein